MHKYTIILSLLIFHLNLFSQNYKEYISQGKSFFTLSKYMTALERFDLAYETAESKKQKEEARIWKNKSKEKIREQQKELKQALENTTAILRTIVSDSVDYFYSYFEKFADYYLKFAHYNEALTYYRLARLSHDLPRKRKKYIEEIEIKLKKLDVLNYEAISHFKKMDFRKAESTYKRMLVLLPGDSILLKRIWHCQNPAFNKNKLVLIKGGEFTMGTSADYAGLGETPHKVILSDFYIGKHEVTNAEYVEFLNIYGSDIVRTEPYAGQQMVEEKLIYFNNTVWEVYKDSTIDFRNYPVVHVSWFGANEFCNFWNMQLPTEAQWEFAARNRGQNYKYAWGNTEPDKVLVANLADNTAAGLSADLVVHTNYSDFYPDLAPVASFKANELGIYDLGGNVWEWCLDNYTLDFYPKSEGAVDPVNLEYSNFRMLRGGSWMRMADQSITTHRLFNPPNHRFTDVGFRVASKVK